MNLVFVNATHPTTPHISSVRAWRFGKELSNRGHRVILVCASCKDRRVVDGEAITRHDWRSPFVFACDPGRAGWLAKECLPALARKALTAWRMLRRGGELGEWTVYACQAFRQLSAHYEPDVVWATFGKMESVFVARQIARDSRCPWVLDIKDNWELYVPSGLRRLMVVRTGGWTAITANARFTQEKARIWQRGNATVVHSGVDDAFFAAPRSEVDDRGWFCINLVGGLYFRERLDALVVGVKQWAASLVPASRSRVRLCYLGGDLRLFAEATGRVDIGVTVEALGYRPVAELAQYCRRAAVNAYIAHPGTFHHKLLELLACGRPVLAFPRETGESWQLARRVSGDLRTPATPSGVAAELTRLHARWRLGAASTTDPQSFSAYSWASQAEILEQALQRAAGRMSQYNE